MNRELKFRAFIEYESIMGNINKIPVYFTFQDIFKEKFPFKEQIIKFIKEGNQPELYL